MKINAELESDIMIRAIHDVKGIDMGNSLVRYKVNIVNHCNFELILNELYFEGRNGF